MTFSFLSCSLENEKKPFFKFAKQTEDDKTSIQIENSSRKLNFLLIFQSLVFCKRKDKRTFFIFDFENLLGKLVFLFTFITKFVNGP